MVGECMIRPDPIVIVIAAVFAVYIFYIGIEFGKKSKLDEICSKIPRICLEMEIK